MSSEKLNLVYIRVANTADSENSIATQRNCIFRYQQKHPDLTEHCEEIIDSGYSGLDSQAPGLVRLLQLVKQDLVAIIIVSDLSRLTRNHKLARYYIEDLFPKHHVQLIVACESENNFPEITIEKLERKRSKEKSATTAPPI